MTTVYLLWHEYEIAPERDERSCWASMPPASWQNKQKGAWWNSVDFEIIPMTSK